jgi:hypothetical protein
MRLLLFIRELALGSSALEIALRPKTILGVRNIAATEG